MSDGVNPKDVLLVQEDVPGTTKQGGAGSAIRRKVGRMAGGVRDKMTMLEMKAYMASLWKNGDTYAEIAERVSDEFGLVGDERFKANSIHFHMKNMLEYWRQVGLLHIDERQAMVLARYDQLEMLATEAYFASCQGKSTSNYKKQVDMARSKEREKILREQIAEERARKKSERTGHGKDNPKFDFEFNDGELAESMLLTKEKVEEYTRHEETPSGDPRWVSILVDINDKRARLWGLLSKKGPANEDQERARLTDEQRDERLAAVLSAAMHRKAQGQTNLAPPSPLGGWTDEDQTTITEDGPALAQQGPLGQDEDEELGPIIDVEPNKTDTEEEFVFDFGDLSNDE